MYGFQSFTDVYQNEKDDKTKLRTFLNSDQQNWLRQKAIPLLSNYPNASISFWATCTLMDSLVESVKTIAVRSLNVENVLCMIFKQTNHHELYTRFRINITSYVQTYIPLAYHHLPWNQTNLFHLFALLFLVPEEDHHSRRPNVIQHFHLGKKAYTVMNHMHLLFVQLEKVLPWLRRNPIVQEMCSQMSAFKRITLTPSQFEDIFTFTFNLLSMYEKKISHMKTAARLIPEFLEPFRLPYTPRTNKPHALIRFQSKTYELPWDELSAAEQNLIYMAAVVGNLPNVYAQQIEHRLTGRYHAEQYGRFHVLLEETEEFSWNTCAIWKRFEHPPLESQPVHTLELSDESVLGNFTNDFRKWSKNDGGTETPTTTSSQPTIITVPSVPRVIIRKRKRSSKSKQDPGCVVCKKIVSRLDAIRPCDMCHGLVHLKCSFASRCYGTKFYCLSCKNILK